MSLKTLKQIAIGYTNLIKEKAFLLPEETKELSEKRMAVCKECPLFNPTIETCGVCHCYMPAATKVLDKKCPENHW